MQKHHSIPPLHPGELIREDIIPELGISKAELARNLGVSRQTFYDIVNEKQPITAEMAVRFGKLFGNGSQFWINLQRDYDLVVAEKKVDTRSIPTLSVAA